MYARGGLSISKDEQIVDAMRSLRSHGWIRHKSQEEINKIAANGQLDPNFIFTMQGFNTRISEPQGNGIVQIRKLDKFVEQTKTARIYKSLIKELILRQEHRRSAQMPNHLISGCQYPKKEDLDVLKFED